MQKPCRWQVKWGRGTSSLCFGRGSQKSYRGGLHTRNDRCDRRTFCRKVKAKTEEKVTVMRTLRIASSRKRWVSAVKALKKVSAVKVLSG